MFQRILIEKLASYLLYSVNKKIFGLTANFVPYCSFDHFEHVFATCVSDQVSLLLSVLEKSEATIKIFFQWQDRTANYCHYLQIKYLFLF